MLGRKWLAEHRVILSHRLGQVPTNGYRNVARSTIERQKVTIRLEDLAICGPAYANSTVQQQKVAGRLTLNRLAVFQH
jgi:hypothetical protein